MVDLQRIYAHEIVYEGMTYRNHVIELNRNTMEVRVYPYEREIHSTTYYSGHIRVTLTDGKLVAHVE